MTWLWTDTLAARLIEQDRAAEARLAGWLERPVAYRLADGADADALARALLESEPPEHPPPSGAQS